MGGVLTPANANFKTFSLDPSRAARGLSQSSASPVSHLNPRVVPVVAHRSSGAGWFATQPDEGAFPGHRQPIVRHRDLETVISRLDHQQPQAVASIAGIWPRDTAGPVQTRALGADQ